MHVPEWIIRVIISYLEKRTMHVKFRGQTSGEFDMNGGFPQGTLLGGILYICYVNPVGFPAEITSNPDLIKLISPGDMIKSDKITSHVQPPQPSEPLLPATLNSVKFVDDKLS